MARFDKSIYRKWAIIPYFRFAFLIFVQKKLKKLLCVPKLFIFVHYKNNLKINYPI